MKEKEDNTMKPEFEYLNEVRKERSRVRVAFLTPQRIQYTISELNKLGASYELKNRITGQFNIRLKYKNNLLTYYCSTGTIMINNKVLPSRGIENVLQIIRNDMFPKG